MCLEREAYFRQISNLVAEVEAQKNAVLEQVSLPDNGAKYHVLVRPVEPVHHEPHDVILRDLANLAREDSPAVVQVLQL
ncbi:hypothetical protein B5F33_00830 [Collinsella sp. An2]|nr:hypothetical protein B5F33_00830 [Collinsella sp. An2]